MTRLTSVSSKPSPRLLRAAAAERAELATRRKQLMNARQELQAQLEELERAITEVDEREMLLDRLAPASTDQPPTERREARADPPKGETLRGPAIRQAAVRAMRERAGVEALHYRAWYQLLLDAGYTVAGKDPLAVFLTQLGRSPLVRKSTQAGVYELDHAAPGRLQRDLARLQEEMRQITAPTQRAELGEIRARRAQLTTQMNQIEKALEEIAQSTEAATCPRATAADPDLQRAVA